MPSRLVRVSEDQPTLTDGSVTLRPGSGTADHDFVVERDGADVGTVADPLGVVLRGRVVR